MLSLWRNFGLYLNANVRRGNYRPLYVGIGCTAFLGGCFIEFMMIKWRPNGVNFYDTFKDNLARDIADKRENQVDQVSKDGR